jgi:hypothetical protein
MMAPGLVVRLTVVHGRRVWERYRRRDDRELRGGVDRAIE